MKLQQLQVALIVLGLVSGAMLQQGKQDLGSHAAGNVNEIKLHDALKAIENFIEAEENPNTTQAGKYYIVRLWLWASCMSVIIVVLTTCSSNFFGT